MLKFRSKQEQECWARVYATVYGQQWGELAAAAAADDSVMTMRERSTVVGWQSQLGDDDDQ